MIGLKISRKLALLLSLVSVMILSSCTSSNGSANEDIRNLSDQTIVFFGDSITQNFETEGKSYPDIVSEITQAEAINLGFGGTSMSVHPNNSFNAFAFHSLANAIVDSDFTAQKSALADPSIPNYFEEKLLKLEKVNWNKVDIITIMYGSNDWGKPIENESDLMDVSSFKGAGRVSLDKILKKHPHLQVLFIPTIYRFWPDYNNVDTDISINALGIKSYQYSDAMAELAKEFKFPYVDTLYGLGINKYNRNLYFNSIDGTHPNEQGTQKIAEKVAKSLLFHY